MEIEGNNSQLESYNILNLCDDNSCGYQGMKRLETIHTILNISLYIILII